MSGIRVAVDVGGTFTDVVTLNDDGGLNFDKVPTTPTHPTRGVLGAFERSGVELPAASLFTHGTTLGLNALLTRTGARTAIVTTRGFRDVYLLGRTSRRVNYDIKYRKPTALVARRDTFEVAERMTFTGDVHTELDVASVRAVATEIGRRGYDSVAVALLHSYANPEHELAVRDIVRELAPGVEVTLSHELSREYHEYERTSTAVLDAYIKPIMRRYLKTLDDELDERGFTGQFLMTRSAGGTMTASTAMEQPVGLILSGPAGGVIGAAALSDVLDEPNLITIDMGGTSLDASLILDGEPVLYQGAEFEQLPINMPSLYIHTIGAGGGSIASLDAAGALQVGPASAGAMPGPASYGNGGTQPTFTDAALAVGYLGAESPLGGTLTLDADLAVDSLRPIAATLGLTERELARGILLISVTKIVGAVRAITVDLGRDPRDFALLAFGGGGGLVAVDVARELGIPKVIVPPGQGAFSAFGMLMADVQHDFAQTWITPLDGIDVTAVESKFAELEDSARAAFAEDGFAPTDTVLVRSIDVRYSGQEHAVTLAFPTDTSEFAKLVAARFAEQHERQYGHAMPDPVEITTLRVRGVRPMPKPTLPELGRGDSRVTPTYGDREVFVSADEPTVRYSQHHREELLHGDVVTGPAVVAEHTATTVLHRGDLLTVGRFGELVITVAAEGVDA